MKRIYSAARLRGKKHTLDPETKSEESIPTGGQFFSCPSVVYDSDRGEAYINHRLTCAVMDVCLCYMLIARSVYIFADGICAFLPRLWRSDEMAVGCVLCWKLNGIVKGAFVLTRVYAFCMEY